VRARPPGSGPLGGRELRQSFIDVDATGVIGTLWSVDDKTAHEVAIEFYEQVLRRPETPFAEILRRIRMRGYEESGQDSWAAYCFCGDPAARG
jgi:CHAT domain-containing protein